MSAYNAAVKAHYTKNPFRYVVPHFGPNRAQRRAGGHRHPHTGKLIASPSRNITYRSGMFGDQDA